VLALAAMALSTRSCELSLAEASSQTCSSPPPAAGYDTYLSRCHSPCKYINRSPMFGCNGSYYVLC
jgi:hypothetical protein